MRVVDRSALVPYSAEQMYALVDDVEHYPEFLPWCTSAEVLERTGAEVRARLGMGYGPLNTAFSTRNERKPPDSMTMHLLDGPFSSLEGRWQFEPVGDAGCEVRLRVEFDFASRVQDRLLGVAFERLCNELIDAFIRRAHSLYGQ